MTTSRVKTRARTEAESPDSPSLHVVTFGCQMNKYDSLLVEGRFQAHGYRMAEEMDEADVILFNTCSVRDHAEERVYSWMGKLKEAKQSRPNLVIGVMGCMAQRAEEEIFQRAAHVDLVCGTRQLQNLPHLVDEVIERRQEAAPGDKAQHLLETDMQGDVVVDRAEETYNDGLVGHLAVMRGCDLNCTYCIVPSVRGRVRSRPIADLVSETQWMVAGGARVVTLLGQTVNSYGEDLPKPGAEEPQLSGRQGRASLADLLRALQEVEGLFSIRLITLHPSYMTPALAMAIRDCDKLDRFLPLPAQSGSNEVLKRMKRGYTVDLYRERIEMLRSYVPDIELGSDWIVGFPGESDEDFEASLAFCEEIGFVQGYVFQYSPRPGTKAFKLEDDIPLVVKKERNQRLLRASEHSAVNRMDRFVGQEIEVLIEAADPKVPGRLRGRSRHNLPISVFGDADLVGSLQRIRVGEASAFCLAGELV